MKTYRIEYSVVTRDELPADAGDRLARALDAMPGTISFESASATPADRTLRAAFSIGVRLGMADAARDGSRLAKEAVKGAGFGAAQLVELQVRLAGDSRPWDEPASQRHGGGRSLDGAPAGGAR
jgi:hypothetical protein